MWAALDAHTGTISSEVFAADLHETLCTRRHVRWQVFCIATAAHHDCLQLYERFYKGFSPFGEPNIPIDTGGPGCSS